MLDSIWKNEEGNLLMEVLVVLVVVGILLTSFSAFPYTLVRSAQEVDSRQTATTYAIETISALRGIQFDNWVLIPNSPYSNPYHIEKNSTGWYLAEGVGENEDYQTKIIFSDVYRDVNGNISDSGTLDPYTKKAEIVISWIGSVGENETNFITYISNWQTGYGIEENKSLIAHWSLDENSGDTAYDSINSNDGIINGASWFPGISNSALKFDGTGFIEISDSEDLDLSSPFTIESWFKPDFSWEKPLEGKLSYNLIDQFSIDSFNGENSSVVQVSDDVYLAVVSKDRRYCSAITFNVYSDGSIGSAYIDSYEFESDRCQEQELVHFHDDIYSVSYRGTGDDGYVVNLQVSNEGIIQKSLVDSVEFDTEYASTTDILAINNNVLLISYSLKKDEGKLATVSFDENGSSGQIADQYIFDSNLGEETNLIQINDNIYAVVYRGVDNHGFVSTFQISSEGYLENIIDTYEFNNLCFYPDIEKVYNDIYVIVSSGRDAPESGPGVADTISIGSDGIINKTIIDHQTIFNGIALYSDVMKLERDLFIYSNVDDSDRMWISSFKIDNDGNIEDTIIDSLDYTLIDYEPFLIKISDDVFGVLHNARSDIIDFVTIGITGILDKNLEKENSYGIDFPNSELTVNINDLELSTASIDDWNHVIFTYDNTLPSDQFKLYLNGTLANSVNYIESVDVNNFPLYIGKNYAGIIDEVSIYNYALSSEDVENNYSELSFDQFLEAQFFLDENSGVNIYNPVNDYYGEINGAVWTEGISGSGLNFDGNDYVALDMFYENGDSIDELSLSVWFKTSFSGADYDDNWALIDFDRSEWYSFYVRGDNGKLGFSGQDGSGGVTGYFDISSDSVVNDDLWHYGVLVFDSNNDYVKFYLDGELDGEFNYSAMNPLDDSTTRFGFIGDGSEATSFDGTRNNRYYEGSIDNLQIYHKVLSEEEIENIYNKYK